MSFVTLSWPQPGLCDSWKVKRMKWDVTVVKHFLGSMIFFNGRKVKEPVCSYFTTVCTRNYLPHLLPVIIPLHYNGWNLLFLLHVVDARFIWKRWKWGHFLLDFFWTHWWSHCLLDAVHRHLFGGLFIPKNRFLVGPPGYLCPRPPVLRASAVAVLFFFWFFMFILKKGEGLLTSLTVELVFTIPWSCFLRPTFSWISLTTRLLTSSVSSTDVKSSKRYKEYFAARETYAEDYLSK